MIVGLGVALAAGAERPAIAGLLAAPGLGRSLLLSLGTGVSATILAYGIALAAEMARARGGPLDRFFARTHAPLIGAPHAAVALGLFLLAAPNGVIARLIFAFLSAGTPHESTFPQDSWGLGLIMGLALKESLFLMVVMAVAARDVGAAKLIMVARGLGHGPTGGWARLVPAAFYSRLRLPVFAVLAYGVTNVDMAMVLGPTNPPSFAVMIARWIGDPSVESQSRAVVGGLAQMAVVGVAFALWLLLEGLVAALWRRAVTDGRKGWLERPLGIGATLAHGVVVITLGLAVLALALWSFAAVWRWPDPLPSAVSFASWRRALPMLVAPGLTSLLLGLAVSGLAVVTAMALLEIARGDKWRRRVILTVLTPPLLIPPIVVLPGLQAPLLRANLDGAIGAVILVQLIFVLPYALLTLAGPHRALDPRLLASARALGASRLRILFRVTLPLLRGPLAAAAAISFAASVGQYVTTLFVGAGRVQSLVTEGLAISAGGDRRLIGVFGVAQMLLPWAGFALAARLGRRRCVIPP